ncbi:nuclear transport factor 2 family protein [Streptomyces sp. NPDC102274]|uniref:nuclear transport factor 2 family protein n=1 Tax=Streptomyces sp. NPDC102274 TaxID=3366151 RepID=UPI00380AC5FC
MDGQLVDRAAINDRIVSLAYAQDDRRWDLLHRIFTSRLTLDLSSHLGGPPQEVSVEELAEGMRRALAGFDVTNHATSNIQIEIDGTRARCRTYVHAYHYLDDAPSAVKFCSMRGEWIQNLERIDDQWRIRTWAVRRNGPVDGDERLYRIAASRVPA